MRSPDPVSCSLPLIFCWFCSSYIQEQTNLVCDGYDVVMSCVHSKFCRMKYSTMVLSNQNLSRIMLQQSAAESLIVEYVREVLVGTIQLVLRWDFLHTTKGKHNIR